MCLLVLAACNTVPTRTPGGNTIVMGRATWDTGWFQAEVFEQLLTELEYTVIEPDADTLADLGYALEESSTLDPDVFYPAAAQGAIDMWPNGWFPSHTSFIDQEDVEGRLELVGYQVRAGALQGYLIDKTTADEYGITNLDDFEDPEIAAVFDRDGDGKADLIGCNRGWGCELTINHHLDAYNLQETVEHVQGTYQDLMVETVEQYEQGEPIFFYTWTPNWTIGKLIPGEDVVWIEVPFASLTEDQRELEELTTIDGVDGCVADICRIGWPPNDIRVVANRNFLEHNPSVKRLLELVEIPLTDISQQNARMFDGEDSPEDIEQHAQEWIEQNRDIVDEWLEEARTAADDT
jgi:glycine betaine/proline transport system substrate-binding protein